MIDSAYESAPFAIAVEDYRRAFALGLATQPDRLAPFRTVLLARWFNGWFYGSLVCVIGGVLWGAYFGYHYRGGVGASIGEALHLGVGGTLLMVPLALVLAAWQTWDVRQWRRRFPRDQAAWKRPQRLRIRWDAGGLTQAGEDGFSSFAWSALHAWIDADREVVIFTGVLDPLPVPHAALGEDGLADLRARLVKAEVPREWRLLSDTAQQLTRVFR